MVKCKKCGLVYVNPRRSQLSLYEGYKYDKNAIKYYDEWYKDRYEFSKSFVYPLIDKYHKGRKEKIIDIGSGTGAMLDYAKENGYKLIYGTDLNKYVVEHSNSINKNIKFFCVDICKQEEMKFLPNDFDVVISHHTLEHVWDPLIALKNIYHLLRKGGLFLVIVPNMEKSLIEFKNYDGKTLSEVFDPDAHVVQFTRKTLVRMLKRAKFKVVTYPNIDSDKLKVKYLIRKTKRLLFRNKEFDSNLSIVAYKK